MPRKEEYVPIVYGAPPDSKPVYNSSSRGRAILYETHTHPSLKTNLSRIHFLSFYSFIQGFNFLGHQVIGKFIQINPFALRPHGHDALGIRCCLHHDPCQFTLVHGVSIQPETPYSTVSGTRPPLTKARPP